MPFVRQRILRSCFTKTTMAHLQMETIPLACGPHRVPGVLSAPSVSVEIQSFTILFDLVGAYNRVTKFRNLRKRNFLSPTHLGVYSPQLIATQKLRGVPDAFRKKVVDAYCGG